MGKRLDLVGQKFGRLKVVEFAGINKHDQLLWKCRCDCGNTKIILGCHLKSKHTKSCGCLKIELSIKRNKSVLFFEMMKGKFFGEDNPNYKHGLSGTKEYKNAANAKRKVTKLNQTPDNANLTKIQLYYTICAYLNEPCETSMWNVDHIQPISKGGHHHEDNLQILTAKVNFEKSNKWPLTAEEKIKYGGLKI